MKDFTKIGETYTTIFEVVVIMIIGMILGAVIVICLTLFLKKGKYKKSIQSSDLYQSIYDIAFIIFIFGFTVFVVSLIVLISVIMKHDTYQDYKGRFEIVKSEADIVKNDRRSSENKIVLKDKHGYQQEIEVNSMDGIFQKGKYADVTVRAVEGKDKPTLAKPINNGDVEIKTIKQAEK